MRTKPTRLYLAVALLCLLPIAGLYLVPAEWSAGVLTPESTLQRKKLRKKERIKARSDQEIAMTRDPKLGYIPFERLRAAKAYTDAVVAKQLKGGLEKDAIAGVTWISEGPMNVGGRTRALMFDPNDTSNERVFAGGVSGGLWKNEDITSAASTWTKIDDFLPTLTITSLVFDPNNTSTFYAGTGEAYSSVSPGDGIFISTDAGNTWAQMANSGMFRYISEIKVRNEGGTSVVYVASHEKYVGQTAAGDNTFLGVSGLFRTADNGVTWTQVLPNTDGGNAPIADEVEIAANGDLWASTGTNAFGDKGGDIYTCSTGCGSSANWTKRYDASDNGFSDIDRTVIALAPSNTNVIYAVTGKNGAGNLDVGYFIKSTDGGANWSNLAIPLNYDNNTCTTIPTEHFTHGQATYDLVMTVHPTNADVVLLGGIDMYRTIDGFSTVNHIGSWFQGASPCDQEIHADHHAVVWRPGSTNEIVFGNDGGVYYSTNAGDATQTAPTFVHHSNGYNVSQCYAVDISPTAGANEYLAGLQDNGTQDWDIATGSVTTDIFGGDGGFCHIDQTEPNIQIASYVFNDYGITTDEWGTKVEIVAPAQSGRFINPTDYDDTNNILYGASHADQISRLSGIGTTNTFTDGIPIGGDGLDGKMATAFRVDRNVPTTLYIGTDGGKVFKVLNANSGTLTSTEISGTISGSLPAGWISSIDVQKGNSNHLLVTLSNYGTVSVWESMDGGTSWRAVEGNLPDMPIRWGIFSPVNGDQAFVATEFGVWSTDDLNGAATVWGVTNTGLANVRTDMIKYRESDNTLIVGTFGRGAYTFSLNTPPDGECFASISFMNESVASATYRSATTITTTGTVSLQPAAAVVFKAGSSILLGPGFSTTGAASFNALIEACTPAVRLAPSPEVEELLSVAANTEGPEMGVFPNPARQRATVVITLDREEEVDLRLIDLQGRIHYRADRQPLVPGQNQIPIETGSLPAGLYFLQVSTPTCKETLRLAVKH